MRLRVQAGAVGPTMAQPVASFQRGILRALGAVAVAMEGLRRHQDRARDFAALKCPHVRAAASWRCASSPC